MKDKSKINMYAAILVLLLFIVSMAFPQIALVTKALAIAIYITVCYVQIVNLKKAGESYEKTLLLSVVMSLIFIYLFYFVK